VVFESYFARKPPFDGEDSKEFPDGFVVEALAQWCRAEGDKMYIVTEDKAMTRAAIADEHLLPMNSIHEVLTRAVADLSSAAEAVAEAILSDPAFDSSLEAALRRRMEEVVYVYDGDLPDGDAYEGKLLSIEEINDWSVVGSNDHLLSLILNAKLKVLVEIQYEDRDHAFFDKEDGRWFGAEIGSTKVEDEIEVEVLVEIERGTGIVREARVLNEEVSINGSADWDY
jgi:hypothetical protein